MEVDPLTVAGVYSRRSIRRSDAPAWGTVQLTADHMNRPLPPNRIYELLAPDGIQLKFQISEQRPLTFDGQRVH